MKGIDSKGPYYKWGSTGHKYYFATKREERIALDKCMRQARAIEANKFLERKRRKVKKNKKA